MKSPFDLNRPTRPILAPLAAQRQSPRELFDRLPPFVAPVAVTIVGGLALVVALVAYLSSTADNPAPTEVASATAPAVSVAQPPEAEDVSETPASRAESKPAAGTASETEPAARDEAAAPETAEPATRDAGETDLALAEDVPAAAPPAASGDAGTAEKTAAGEAAPAEPDPGRTSSIPPARPGGDALAPEVQVAETEEEIAALETIQRREVEADVGPPSQEWTNSVGTTASVEPAPPSRLVAATTTKWVNMRDGPADEAEVLMVVPALEEIQAETGCNWCAVTYDGKAGFIYKTFISYAEEEPATDEPVIDEPAANEAVTDEAATEEGVIDDLPGVE